MKMVSIRSSVLEWGNIMVSMQDYLTDVWKLNFTHAAGILNIWGGISKVLQVFFVFFADVFLGDFKMLVISSISYCVGMSLLAMSMQLVLANATGTCEEYEVECALLYTGMALIAVGMADIVVAKEPELLSEAQDNESHTYTVVSFRTIVIVILVLATIAGFILFPYIKQWLMLFGLSGICMVCATIIFLLPWKWYKEYAPKALQETRRGRQNWFQDSLNKSRLDRYYWLLAALSALNLLISVPVVLNCEHQSWETNEKAPGDE